MYININQTQTLVGWGGKGIWTGIWIGRGIEALGLVALLLSVPSSPLCVSTCVRVSVKLCSCCVCVIIFVVVREFEFQSRHGCVQNHKQRERHRERKRNQERDKGRERNAQEYPAPRTQPTHSQHDTRNIHTHTCHQLVDPLV